MTLNPADLGDGKSYEYDADGTIRLKVPETPLDDLLAQLAAAQAEVEAEAQKPVTLADLAAAAFTALETVVTILGGPESTNGKQVIDEFESRAAAFAESLELEG